CIYPFITQANTKGFSDAVFRVLVDSLLLIDAALVSMLHGKRDEISRPVNVFYDVSRGRNVIFRELAKLLSQCCHRVFKSIFWQSHLVVL
ncbi:hypothetical protein OFN34_31170, partial [Escherichia coli]|nr:hypothetical protein [Escherichia coli]